MYSSQAKTSNVYYCLLAPSGEFVMQKYVKKIIVKLQYACQQTNERTN